MHIYLSCANKDAFGGLRRITNRTDWYWFPRIDGEYDRTRIDFDIMRRHDQAKPATGEMISLDIEGVPRKTLVEQMPEVLDYYNGRYPSKKIFTYRLFPRLKNYYWDFAGWDQVRNNTTAPEYWHRRRQWGSWLKDIQRTYHITKKTSLVSTRAYMPHDPSDGPDRWWVFWRSMRVYHELAHMHNDPVAVWLQPHYASTEKSTPWNPIPVDRWIQKLNTAADEWKADYAIIFIFSVNGGMPKDLQRATLKWIEDRRRGKDRPAQHGAAL